MSTLFESGKKTHRTRANRVEEKVIPLHPVFTNVKQIDEDTRNTKKIIRGEAKKNTTWVDCRSQGRSPKEQGLNPVQATLGKRAGDKEVVEGLQRKTTKTRRLVLVPERDETLSCIKHSVSDLPAKVAHQTIKRHELEGPPGRGPIKGPERRAKLGNTMGLNWIKLQKKSITRLTRDISRKLRRARGPNPHSQLRGKRRTSQSNPGSEQGGVERPKTRKRKTTRLRKDLKGSCSQTISEPVSHKETQTIGTGQ